MLHLSGKDQGKLKAKIVADGDKIHTPGGFARGCCEQLCTPWIHHGEMTMLTSNVDTMRACSRMFRLLTVFLGIVASG